MPGGVVRMDGAKAALLAVLEQIPRTTQVGILVFSGDNVPDEWIYPLGPRDDDKLRTAIARPQPNGGTPLGAYLKKGADRLLVERARQHGYGTYRLLVVTDGQASDSAVVDAHLPEVLGRGLTVDLIGVGMNQEHKLAKAVHSYRSAADQESLRKAISEVFAEVRGAGAGGADQAADFELLEGLPHELATAMLGAVGRLENAPIGERPAPPPAPPAESGGAAGGAAAPGGPPAPAPAPAPTGGGGLCGLAPFGLLSLWALGRRFSRRTQEPS